MLTEVLKKIKQNQHLSEQEAYDLVEYLGTGEAEHSQIAEFLTGIKAKGETVEEITGFARCMREKAVRVDTEGLGEVVDSCGTGGDCTNTFNISTAAAIVAAAADIKVAKHSNVSFSSKCGSSNVLEALGIPLIQTPEAVLNSLKTDSIAFLHAPYFHNSTKHVNQVRKELGIRTIFNFLGPLTNPAKPTGQVIGVCDPVMLPKIAEVLKNLGCRRAMVVSGTNPVMDELSICGETLVYELNEGKITSYTIKPEDFGLKTATIEDIKGGLPDENAQIIRDIFAGKDQGAKLDILSLNAGALLWAGNRVETLKEGIELVKDVIQSGKAAQKLENLSS